MLEGPAHSLLSEYLVLSTVYSLVAAVLVELLLRLWRIRGSGTRVKFRLTVLGFPPALALAYPYLRSTSPLGALADRWMLLDSGTLVQMVHNYLPWAWFLVALVTLATTVHFVAQVLVPLLRRPRQGIRLAEGAISHRLTRAYLSAVGATGLSPRLEVTEGKEPAAEVRGLISPSVVISTALVELLDDEELESVLGHEFAHVGRADIAMSWLATALRSLMFFNPLAALVHTSIVLDVERVCDDCVISMGGNPVAFASALVKIHRASAMRSSPRFCSLAVRVASWESHALRSFTVERVNRVMEPNRPVEVPLARLRLALAITALVVILLFVV